MSQISNYYQLIKPGVTYGNVLTVVAGYFLAAAGVVDMFTLLSVTIGMTFVIASACVANNYLDQDIDALMERTKKRPSVAKLVPQKNMVVFSALLLAGGLLLLNVGTNMLTVGLAIIGFVTYVWLYGAFSKRKSEYGTIVGSVSGAIPIAAGYAAVSGQVDVGMIIVFFILFFWQFPEFYSIAIYRRKEYKAAGIPLITITRGVTVTIRHIFVYTVLYVFSTLLLTFYGYTGLVYFLAMMVLGVWWIYIAYVGLSVQAHEHVAWAKRMFRFSMITILLLCIFLSVGSILP